MFEKEIPLLYQIPEGKVDVVLDTDTYNEIDDQFAIAYALKNQEKLNIIGFTCAPFRKSTRVKDVAEGQIKSYEETEKVLRLGNQTQFLPHIYHGATQFLPDEQTPVACDAVDFLVSASKKYSPERRLYVLATGAITNVASAILLDKSITDRIVVIWLGGDSLGWWKNDEYNMKQDIAAARVVLSSGVPFVHIPVEGVVSNFSTTKYELEYFLKGKNPLADYLVENSVNYVQKRNPNKAWSKVIWDVVVPAWLLNDGNRFMCGRMEKRYLPAYQGKCYETPPLEKEMFYVHQIFRDPLMSDLFEKLAEETK